MILTDSGLRDRAAHTILPAPEENAAMQSKAKTVAAYLQSLPTERREAIAAVRKVILDNLDPDFEESMQYGMIGYCVPHRVFPAGYHCDPKLPLPFAGLASQKNYMSLYLMSVYGGSSEEVWLRAAWKQAGKKLDMGKCCIRFKRLDDLPLDTVAEAFRRVPARAWVAYYQASLDPRTGKPRSDRAKAASGKRATGTKATARAGKAKPAPKAAARRKSNSR